MSTDHATGKPLAIHAECPSLEPQLQLPRSRRDRAKPRWSHTTHKAHGCRQSVVRDEAFDKDVEHDGVKHRDDRFQVSPTLKTSAPNYFRSTFYVPCVNICLRMNPCTLGWYLPLLVQGKDDGALLQPSEPSRGQNTSPFLTSSPNIGGKAAVTAGNDMSQDGPSLDAGSGSDTP